MYLDDIITKWQTEDIKDISLPKYQQLLMLLFISDQVIISNREDNLQKAAYKFSQILTEHGLTISVQGEKLMAFKGQDPVRNKIVIDNKIIEQVNSFNYLGNLVSYERKWTLLTNCVTI
jgi:hypothetical protein